MHSLRINYRLRCDSMYTYTPNTEAAGPPEMLLTAYITTHCTNAADCRSRWCASQRTCHPTQGSRVKTRLRAMDFKGNKNPQHAFLRRESKAVGTMS
jgi:hypothetical protein